MTLVPNNVLAKSINWLSVLLRRLLLSTTRVHSVDGCYRLKESSGKYQLEQQKDAALSLFNIVLRDSYYESVKNYPISDVAELKRVLRLSGEEGSDYLIGDYLNGSRQVQQFCYKLQVGYPCWVLPASLLISAAQQTQHHCLQVEDGFSKWFIASFNGKVVSQQAVGPVNSVEMFSLVQGLPTNLPVSQVGSSELPALLAKGLLPVLTSYPGNFFQLNLLQFWQKCRVPVAILLLSYPIYLMTAFTYLSYQQHRFEQQELAMGPKIDTLLQTQAEVQQNATQLSAISNFMSQKFEVSQLISLLKHFHSLNVQLLDVRQNKRTVELLARAPRAAETLSEIRKLSQVESAEFSAATAKIGELEEFRLRITLKPTELPAGGQ